MERVGAVLYLEARHRKTAPISEAIERATEPRVTTPRCPPSGKLSFLGFYGDDDPIPDITRTVELSCPGFRR
jgi:hypothetical protein